MEFASKGVAGTGLGLGAAALGINLLNGNLGNLFGMGGCNSGCGDNALVNRYELGLEKSNAAKDSEIAALKSTISTDNKMLEMYQYVDGRLRGIEAQIATQAVTNANLTSALTCAQGNIAALMSLTKMVIPNANVCPGWGNVTVTTTPTTTT